MLHSLWIQNSRVIRLVSRRMFIWPIHHALFWVPSNWGSSHTNNPTCEEPSSLGTLAYDNSGFGPGRAFWMRSRKIWADHGRTSLAQQPLFEFEKRMQRCKIRWLGRDGSFVLVCFSSVKLFQAFRIPLKRAFDIFL